jgi:hypothetical protein
MSTGLHCNEHRIYDILIEQWAARDDDGSEQILLGKNPYNTEIPELKAMRGITGDEITG